MALKASHTFLLGWKDGARCGGNPWNQSAIDIMAYDRYYTRLFLSHIALLISTMSFIQLESRINPLYLFPNPLLHLNLHYYPLIPVSQCLP